jgi:nucleotide-binding universal stress UspA family protein
MINKILVPLDGSDLAECTVVYVESLIKNASKGEVTLLNIVKVDIPWADMRATLHPVDMEALRKPLFAASKKYLAKVASKLRSKGIKVKTKALEGNRPADAIVDYAQKEGMDLIVMTTHGHGGFSRKLHLLLGKVAFDVTHKSPVPVLLIRPESCRI